MVTSFTWEPGPWPIARITEAVGVPDAVVPNATRSPVISVAMPVGRARALPGATTGAPTGTAAAVVARPPTMTAIAAVSARLRNDLDPIPTLTSLVWSPTLRPEHRNTTPHSAPIRPPRSSRRMSTSAGLVRDRRKFGPAAGCAVTPGFRPERRVRALVDERKGKP